MAKQSSVLKNQRRQNLVDRYAKRRAALKNLLMDKTLAPEKRFAASMSLAKLPRNSAKDRVRLRCEVTGRPRGNYRKFRLCRNKFREYASAGLIPGMTKASW